MAFFSHPVIAVILLLGLLIIVHELGHFLVGKACGIAVEIFSIGFGPVLINFQRKETSYRLSLIPLGGFVKFYGGTRREDVPAELKGREFYSASVTKRALTVLAGPLANFLLAVVAYSGMVMHGIPHPPAIVGEVMRGSPAEKAGLAFRDRVLAIDGEPVANWHDLQQIVMVSPKRELEFTIERDGAVRTVVIRPEEINDEEMIGRKTRGQIGISPGHIPAVITVTNNQGPFALQGAKTGDKIVQATDANGAHPVKYWQEFAHLVKSGAFVGEQLRIELQSADGGQTKTVVLAMTDLDSGNLDATWQRIGISQSELTIGETHKEVTSPLKVGDKIIELGGRPLRDLFDFRDAVMANQKPAVNAIVLRDGQPVALEIPMQAVEVQKASGKATFYSFPASFMAQLEQADSVIEQHKNPFMALWYGLKETAEQTGMIAVAVGGLFTGDMPLEALGGPISIAKVASDSVRMGWLNFFSALALISINLGLLNLFPIPVLDGGQLILLGVEGVRRRPIGELAVENFQKIGFVMVLALVAMATYNDLSRFWSSMLKGVLGLFQ